MCELQSEELYEGRLSQLYTQLLQLRKESLKKIQACMGFEPLTSAIPDSVLPIKLISQLGAGR